jgi:colanic acid biosynthesis glycosyl transferase WcaI
MRILVISQVFYPDNVSVAQHLSDLCFSLVNRGHKVEVITSQYSYEDKSVRYPSLDIINNLTIRRIWSTGLGKKNTLTRLLDFISFNLSILKNLIFIKNRSYDLIIGLTAPPLLSFFGVSIAKIKSIKFCYWIMDMQPELAIKTGFLKERSFIGNILVRLGNSIQNNSDKIIVLDRFMKEYLIEKNNINRDKIEIVPVWPVIDNVYSGEKKDNQFRIENGFADKIVVMYSGNHSFVHPLDTLLTVARELEKDERFLFVFIGGGVRKKDVTEFKMKYSLKNICQLPYQPREKINLSLGSSDIQVVILGEGLVGFTHPNKIYGALYIGKPILYIGPNPSHITEILSAVDGNIAVNHGESEELMNKILKLCDDELMFDDIGRKNQILANQKFAPDILINKMCIVIENI